MQVGVWAVWGEEDAATRWAPTLEYLKKATERDFVLVPLKYEQIGDFARHGRGEFLIIDPALFVRLEASDDVDVIATLQHSFRDQDCALAASALVCRQDRTDLRSPSDLKGLRLAVSDSRSLLDSTAVVREFVRIGMRRDRDFRLQNVEGGPLGVVKAVLDKDVDAGVLPAGMLETLQADGTIPKGLLHLLAFKNITSSHPDYRVPVDVSTRLYPDWSFVACYKAPPELVREVAAALLTMSDKVHHVIGPYHQAGWTSPRTDIAVHQCLQDLRMPPYEKYGQVSIAQVVRQYMYWFIAAGILFILLVVIDLYVTALNRALVAEIEERKRAETALRESIRRFETIASCSADWIWETDGEGRYTYSSTIVQQMLGYSAEEVIGRDHFDLYATAEKERLRAQGLTSTLASGKRVFRERYRMLTKDGRLVIHESTAQPVINAKGELVGYRGVNRDITDQVRFVRLKL